MEDSEKNDLIQENLETKRVRSKGHYRLITRDKHTGKIVSVKKWSPRSKKDLENIEKTS